MNWSRTGRWALATVFGVSAFALAACAGGSDSAPAALAPAAASPAPRTSVNALMVTMIDNAGHVLWDVEREGRAPKTDADWLEVEDHATQLVAASTVIQLGGTGPADMGWIRQTGWKEHADQMGDAALQAIAAAKAHNLEALVKANGDLVTSCEECHKAFKPSLPTEGITHQRPHLEPTPGR